MESVAIEDPSPSMGVHIKYIEAVREPPLHCCVRKAIYELHVQKLVSDIAWLTCFSTRNADRGIIPIYI